MSHPESLKNGKWVSGMLRPVHWNAAFTCINRPPAGEGLFADCLAVALIISLQVCQSATLHLAAGSCKGRLERFLKCAVMGFGLRVGKVTGDDVCSTFTFALTALAAFLQKWIKKNHIYCLDWWCYSRQHDFLRVMYPGGWRGAFSSSVPDVFLPLSVLSSSLQR